MKFTIAILNISAIDIHAIVSRNSILHYIAFSKVTVHCTYVYVWYTWTEYYLTYDNSHGVTYRSQPVRGVTQPVADRHL